MTTIWHNPRCSKSRTTLELIKEAGITPTIRLYQDDAPTADEIRAALALLNISAKDLIRTGEAIYKERVGSGNSFAGSPIIADGRIFFTSEQGETYIIRAGREFQILGQNTVDEVVMSTPAISDGLIAIRAKSHVYGIGANSTSP